MRSHRRTSVLLRLLVGLAFVLGAAGGIPSSAALDSLADGGRIESMEARGTIGPYRIGLNYTVREHTVLVGAHYFYVSKLKDIPLTGGVSGDAVQLEGQDGSTFHLHFVGNGSEGKQPLTFYNSIGLRGSWTRGQQILPVELEIAHSTENPGTRLYAQVTDRPDSVYEAMIAGVLRAILAGDRAETAKHADFPLRVNGGRHPLMIRNAAELNSHWDRIFTPTMIEKLRSDVPHEMFVHNGEVMLGDGELWFNNKGLTSVNLAGDRASNSAQR